MSRRTSAERNSQAHTLELRRQAKELRVQQQNTARNFRAHRRNLSETLHALSPIPRAETVIPLDRTALNQQLCDATISTKQVTFLVFQSWPLLLLLPPPQPLPCVLLLLQCCRKLMPKPSLFHRPIVRADFRLTTILLLLRVLLHARVPCPSILDPVLLRAAVLALLVIRSAKATATLTRLPPMVLAEEAVVIILDSAGHKYDTKNLILNISRYAPIRYGLERSD
ncbi:hypothetical protein C8R45DRAFT_934090 [Mycena sanguinolenta]|nr:hypothetical protein C8R45DRAFT_934090 [Mycena sanguinolenta]